MILYGKFLRSSIGSSTTKIALRLLAGTNQHTLVEWLPANQSTLCLRDPLAALRMTDLCERHICVAVLNIIMSWLLSHKSSFVIYLQPSNVCCGCQLLFFVPPGVYGSPLHTCGCVQHFRRLSTWHKPWPYRPRMAHANR